MRSHRRPPAIRRLSFSHTARCPPKPFVAASGKPRTNPISHETPRPGRPRPLRRRDGAGIFPSSPRRAWARRRPSPNACWPSPGPTTSARSRGCKTHNASRGPRRGWPEAGRRNLHAQGRRRNARAFPQPAGRGGFALAKFSACLTRRFLGRFISFCFELLRRFSGRARGVARALRGRAGRHGAASGVPARHVRTCRGVYLLRRKPAHAAWRRYGTSRRRLAAGVDVAARHGKAAAAEAASPKIGLAEIFAYQPKARRSGHHGKHPPRAGAIVRRWRDAPTDARALGPAGGRKCSAGARICQGQWKETALQPVRAWLASGAAGCAAAQSGRGIPAITRSGAAASTL